MKDRFITHLSWSMLYITQEFLNSWQELGKTSVMDAEFVSQSVVSTTWTLSVNLARISQISLAIYTEVQGKVKRSVTTYKGYKKQWFNTVLFLLCFELVYLPRVQSTRLENSVGKKMRDSSETDKICFCKKEDGKKDHGKSDFQETDWHMQEAMFLSCYMALLHVCRWRWLCNLYKICTTF